MHCADICRLKIQAKAGLDAIIVNKVKLISQTLAAMPEGVTMENEG